MTMAPNRSTPANDPNTIVSVVVDDAPAAEPSVPVLDDVAACDGSGLYDGDGPAVTTGLVEFPLTTNVSVELTHTSSSFGVNMYDAEVRTDRVGMYLVEHLSPREIMPTSTGSSLSSYCQIGPPLSAWLRRGEQGKQVKKMSASSGFQDVFRNAYVIGYDIPQTNKVIDTESEKRLERTYQGLQSAPSSATAQNTCLTFTNSLRRSNLP